MKQPPRMASPPLDCSIIPGIFEDAVECELQHFECSALQVFFVTDVRIVHSGSPPQWKHRSTDEW